MISRRSLFAGAAVVGLVLGAGLAAQNATASPSRAAVTDPVFKPVPNSKKPTRVPPTVKSESPHVKVKNAAGKVVEKFTMTYSNGKKMDYEVEDIPAQGKDWGTTPAQAAARAKALKASGAAVPSLAAATATGTQYHGMSLTGTADEDSRWSDGYCCYRSSLSFAYDMERVSYSDGTHKDYFRVHNGPYSIIYRTTYPASFISLRFIVNLAAYGSTKYAESQCVSDWTIDCWANGNQSRVFNNAEGVTGVHNGVLGTNKYWPTGGFGASYFRTSMPRNKTVTRNEMEWYFSPCQGYECSGASTSGYFADIADTLFVWSSYFPG
jgi:hypothetical protein